MRIGIDYTAAVKQRAGIGRYTRNLVRTLSLLSDSGVHAFTLFVAGGWGDGDGLGDWPAHFRIRSLPISDRWMHILWQRLRLPVPVQVITGRLDLFHSPDFVLPPTGSSPAVLTVHDLSFLRVPQFFVPGFCEYLTSAVSRAVRRARHVLADSWSTRHDLIELLDVEPERVTVLYPGVESRFQRVSEADALESVQARYELPSRFILGLSTLQPRKNFDGLIGAFGRLLSSGARESTLEDLHLVIAGGRGWMCKDLEAQVSRLGLGDRVCFAGFVEDEDLPALYSLADVFAFPSWYEGFGLPALEAMACGTPVVTANNSSLPEVVGEAGLMADAGDIEGLAVALHRLVSDAELRSRLRSEGPKQASRFSWDQSARGLLEIYDSYQSYN